MLSTMLVTDYDAVVCDLAEYYHIYDMEQYPVTTIATLCVGLRAESRIMQKISEQNADIKTLLLAAAVDRLSFIAWSKTEDAQQGLNRPESIVEKIMGKSEDESEIVAYEDGDELLAEIERIKEEARKCPT